MSQKNELKVLLLSFLLTIGIAGIGLWWFTRNSASERDQNTDDSGNNEQILLKRVTFGEKSLAIGDISTSKKEGTEALANKNYQQAIDNFTASLKVKPNDPETLIFLNNARIGTSKSYTLVASVPMSNEPNTALEILRGVAQAQNEINQKGGIKGVSLKIGIANDENNQEISQEIATALVKHPETLGVVGHYSSDSTLAAGKVYNEGQLVVISPTSTSVNISNFSPYVFRTVPSDFMAARTLANYMIQTLGKKNAAVFFNSQSKYSQSLKAEFVSSVALDGGQVSSEFDLSKADFSPLASIEQAKKQGAEVLILASNSGVLDKALQVIQLNQKTLPLLGGDSFYTIKTLEIGREQALDMVVAVPWHIDGNSNSQFPAESRKLWNADVNWRTAMAYDATQALIAALEVNPTRTGIQQTLSKSDFSATGASGTIRFLPSGDRNAPVQLVKVVKGSRSRTGYDFTPVSK